MRTREQVRCWRGRSLNEVAWRGHRRRYSGRRRDCSRPGRRPTLRRHCRRRSASVLRLRLGDAAAVRRLRRTDTGPVPAERAGSRLARQVRALLRVRLPADGQVLRPRRPTLLSSRLLQVRPRPPKHQLSTSRFATTADRTNVPRCSRREVHAS